MYHHQNKRFKPIYIWVTALFIFCSGILGAFSPVKVQAQDHASNQVTIVSHQNNDSQHPIDQAPQDTNPREGVVYQVWKISETALSEQELQSRVADLGSYSAQELTAAYPTTITSTPTDASGSTGVLTLADGAYFIRELKADASDVLASSVPLVVNLPLVTTNGIQRTVTLYPKSTDVPLGSVLLFKYGVTADGDQIPLAGVTFQLFQASDSQFANPIKVLNGKVSNEDGASSDLKTDAAGEIRVSGLTPGEYVFKEKETLAGYLLDETPLVFTVKAGETASLSMANKLASKGSITLRKIDDQQTPSVLAGASFKITKKVIEDGKETYQTVLKDGQDYVVTSGPDGLVVFTDLPFGTYYIFETRAPLVGNTQYQLLTAPIEVTINSESYKALAIDVINKPSSDTPDQPQKPTKPTKGVRLPNTGDVATSMMVGIGLVLFVLGYYFYRKTEADGQ